MAERTVRLSQTLTPFGVGAVYDVLGDSFIACDTGLWGPHGRPIRAPRLEKSLRVANFREAPSRARVFGVVGDGPSVPYFRFPRWLFCTSCRRMTYWQPKNEEPGMPAKCACHAHRQLVPMRFIMACREGHVADVPWRRWVHATGETADQKQCQADELYFRVRPSAGGGLASLVIECGVAQCRAKRTLAKITSPQAMKELGVRCGGLQPWQTTNPGAGHDEVPLVVQRGASNVHFAQTESALDIPPDSDYSDSSEAIMLVTTHKFWPMVISAPNGPMATGAISVISAETKVSDAQIRQILAQETGAASQADPDDASPEDLLAAEFEAFVAPHDEHDSRSTFVTRHVDLSSEGMGDQQALVTESLTRLFDHVVIATKLREVRALKGFSRIDPSGSLVRPDLGRGLDWLPALEVFGEGVFLALREDLVQAWEHGPALARLADIAARRSGNRMALWLPPASPRFVLLHTFAHLLIRQLAFDSGYSSASLRERVYARAPKDGNRGQAGVLIYTAAGDAEGTLGGLARLGEPTRLAPSLLAMLQRALWCSNDPICRDSPGQGVGGLNRGACHACALISETSCVHSNVLLDRSVLVGDPEAGVSFFEAEVRLAMDRVTKVGV